MADGTVGGEKTVESYLESLMGVFREAVRIVKPTGSIVYNIGDKYLNGSLLLVPYRFAVLATERYDVRLVNNITWVKSNPTPRQFNRRLVSATEPFFHFAKTNGYHYDRDRFMDKGGDPRRSQPSPRLGQRYRELIKTSNLSHSQKELANTALDNAVSSVRSGEIHSFRMKIRGVHAEAFGGMEGGRKSQMDKNGFTIIRIHGRRMKRDVIENPVESDPNFRHCAMYPTAIICEIIKLLCPKGGVVLDPYVGSGTTALAAMKEDRQYIGMDIDPEYCAMAMRRVSGC